MAVTVSVVIPTAGRPSLTRAISSVQCQTRPVLEIIVVVDHDRTMSIPVDDRITLIRTGSAQGAAVSRQRGIDVARGDVIALLDDDDEWYPDKLARQLATVEHTGDRNWVASSRVTVLGPASRRRTWPRRLIGPGESVTDYLFRVGRVGAGDVLLQTSTLCFPTELGRRFRWDGHVDAVHDEPSWLITVQRGSPDVRWIHVPAVLGVYHVDGRSVSRSGQDRTDDYIRWGLCHLNGESPRILGDYLCTSPVSAAVSAMSLAGINRAIRASLRHGRPGLPALTYAVLNGVRVGAVRLRAAIRR
ncbi:glycosyltransferase family 2 protein [Mycolicibacterium confluentis]|uniref:Glycosyl transferase n=1 Tax=Mycolicibacterium confluentis TaxID=28047 RepID=A0A7I7Y0J0_9MYCO|nr:glycosyltransferase family A protein [Mycolicibacterium confluentis]MCV7319834.1 glycosyltransferase family 2 protein [Mycolicibacterium confluentis]BBZ34864.1 glycosyl transferase [Mycolicibacterium confluentis]